MLQDLHLFQNSCEELESQMCVSLVLLATCRKCTSSIIFRRVNINVRIKMQYKACRDKFTFVQSFMKFYVVYPFILSKKNNHYNI